MCDDEYNQWTMCVSCVAVELTQILPEKSSFVSSDNKEVFVPPVLRGVLQEPQLQLSGHRWVHGKAEITVHHSLVYST